MSQHGYMRHMTTPPLVLEIGQKLWQYCPILTTIVFFRFLEYCSLYDTYISCDTLDFLQWVYP